MRDPCPLLGGDAQCVRDFGAELREFNGQTVHPRRQPEGVPARRLQQELPRPHPKALVGDHFWSPLYFAGSCSGPPLAIVNEYIKRQNRPG
ncbi:transposase [Nocardia sp. NPDC059229]